MANDDDKAKETDQAALTAWREANEALATAGSDVQSQVHVLRSMRSASEALAAAGQEAPARAAVVCSQAASSGARPVIRQTTGCTRQSSFVACVEIEDTGSLAVCRASNIENRSATPAAILTTPSPETAPRT